MANTQKLSPQGYNIQKSPLNENPFWEQETGGGNVPAGGLTGQVLTKKSNADYDTEWKTPQPGGGLPPGGAVGDILTKTATGGEWQTPDFASNDDLEDVEQTATAAQTAANEAAAAVVTERNRAQAAEQENATAISTERTRATAAEGALASRLTTAEGNIQQNASDISDEIERAEAAEYDLGELITAEGNRAQAAENTLSGEIDEVADDLATEEQNRAAADTLIRTDMTAAISAEAATRATNDAALQTQIDELSGEIPTPSELKEIPDVKINDVVQTVSLQESNYTSAANNIYALLYQTFNSATQAWQRLWKTISGALVVARLSGAMSDFINRVLVITGVDSDGNIQVGSGGSFVGGTQGQVLTKNSSTAYDWSWETPGGTSESELPVQTYSGDDVTDVTYTKTAAEVNKPAWLCQILRTSPTRVERQWNTLRGFLVEVLNAVQYGTYQGNRFIMTDGSQGVQYGTAATKLVTGLFRSSPTANAGELLVASGSLTDEAIRTDPVNGGTTGQVLTKSSNSNYDWEWKTPTYEGNSYSLINPTTNNKQFRCIPDLVRIDPDNTGTAPYEHKVYHKSSFVPSDTDATANSMKCYESSSSIYTALSDTSYPLVNFEFLPFQQFILNMYDNSGLTGTPLTLILTNPDLYNSGGGSASYQEFTFDIPAGVTGKTDSMLLILRFAVGNTLLYTEIPLTRLNAASSFEYYNTGAEDFAVYQYTDHNYCISKAGKIGYTFTANSLTVRVYPNNKMASFAAQSDSVASANIICTVNLYTI